VESRPHDRGAGGSRPLCGQALRLTELTVAPCASRRRIPIRPTPAPTRARART
jgi:hypothetical protein